MIDNVIKKIDNLDGKYFTIRNIINEIEPNNNYQEHELFDIFYEVYSHYKDKIIMKDSNDNICDRLIKIKK